MEIIRIFVNNAVSDICSNFLMFEELLWKISVKSTFIYINLLKIIRYRFKKSSFVMKIKCKVSRFLIIIGKLKINFMFTIVYNFVSMILNIEFSQKYIIIKYIYILLYFYSDRREHKDSYPSLCVFFWDYYASVYQRFIFPFYYLKHENLLCFIP